MFRSPSLWPQHKMLYTIMWSGKKKKKKYYKKKKKCYLFSWTRHCQKQRAKLSTNKMCVNFFFWRWELKRIYLICHKVNFSPNYFFNDISIEDELRPLCRLQKWKVLHAWCNDLAKRLKICQRWKTWQIGKHLAISLSFHPA